MLKRVLGYLAVSDDPVSEATRSLQQTGHAVVAGLFDEEACAALEGEIASVFDALPPDRRMTNRGVEEDEAFRYEMLNRSALSQRAIASAPILSVIEPLLGDDCHVIANTAWRNRAHTPVSHGARMWHIDAGPHVPRRAGTKWPDEIPYPVFAIAVHILLQDMTLDDGPTAVIAGSHRSGQFPPFDRLKDPDLDYEGEGATPILARRGDVVFFVSDVWHRRMPTTDADRGRFFLQVHYGRRDIAQRLRTTSASNPLSAETIERAQTPRDRTVIGLHSPFFYDG